MRGRFTVAVLDIDGTLTNSKKEITPRTAAVLKQLQQSGVRLVLASGRPTYGIVPLARELEMERYGGYILAYNGGQITECETGREIYSQRLAQELVPKLYEAAKEEGCEILSYDGEVIACEVSDNKYVAYEAMLNKMPIRRVESFVETFNYDVPKCLAVGEPERAVVLVERLQRSYGEVMSIYRSEPFFVELVPLRIDKALSLERLARHLGITRESMIAFGDGFNDLSMIEYAGCGVAMANAQEAVREAADVVTLSNEEDGVAEFVERELLG